MKDKFSIFRFSGLTFAGLLLSFCLMTAQIADAASETEQLIIFVQPQDSPVDEMFMQRSLPEIQNMAQSMGIDVHVVDATRGVPRSVTLTPLIVFQNYRGRSIYQGRTTTPGRIRNFIRTSRYVPQGEEPNRRTNIPVWSRDRSRLWAPLKVASVTGTPPQNYRRDKFTAEALDNIKKGFRKFKLQKTAELGRADRGFWMDFYPWRSSDGTLFLSLALFSEFDCKKPVFSDKIIGPWQKRTDLFRQAAVRMEDAVAQITADPANGDSFYPIARSVPLKNWKQIGLALPPAPKLKTAQPKVSTVVPPKLGPDGTRPR